jgi:hypothetical protein
MLANPIQTYKPGKNVGNRWQLFVSKWRISAMLNSILDAVKSNDIERFNDKMRKAEQAQDVTPNQPGNEQFDLNGFDNGFNEPVKEKSEKKTTEDKKKPPSKDEIAKFCLENDLLR